MPVGNPRSDLYLICLNDSSVCCETLRTHAQPLGEFRVAYTITLTSRLDASRCSRFAAPARRLCTWRRYQRWMVTAAWFTWWINLSKEPESGSEGVPKSLCPRTRTC